MARRKNDGRGRLGGRAKGTPNRATTDLRTWINEILTEGRTQFESDLMSLPPVERVKVYTKVYTTLINYILPKQQAVSVEEQMAIEYRELVKFIETAPDEVADEIAQRVRYITERKNERE